MSDQENQQQSDNGNELISKRDSALQIIKIYTPTYCFIISLLYIIIMPLFITIVKTNIEASKDKQPILVSTWFKILNVILLTLITIAVLLSIIINPINLNNDYVKTLKSKNAGIFTAYWVLSGVSIFLLLTTLVLQSLYIVSGIKTFLYSNLLGAVVFSYILTSIILLILNSLYLYIISKL